MNLILDAKNLCYRAAVVDDLTTRGGRPVYIILVALRMLKKLVHDYKPDKVVMAWDAGKSAWRTNLYPEYKYRVPQSGTFDQKYKDFKSQIESLKTEFLPNLPIAQVEVEGQEADDIIYALVRIWRKEHNLIVSTDQDFFQLLHYADVLSPVKNKLITEKSFVDEFGFGPVWWSSYRAMVGDSSDNIPGVPKIGKVTAKSIVLDGGPRRWIQLNPKKKKLWSNENRKIYRRNLNLISLKRYGQKKLVRERVEQVLREQALGVHPTTFHNALMGAELFSILKDFPPWIKVFMDLFERMEDEWLSQE